MTTVMHRLVMFTFLVGLVCAASFVCAGTSAISGRIVAHNSPLTCLNGNAYWSVIVRIEKPTDVHSAFIRITFSQPCGVSPNWIESTAVRRYRLIRDKHSDEILTEFLKCEDQTADRMTRPCPSIQAWNRVRGMEQELLPYGMTLPSYRAADLPLVPLV